ncbi:MAG: response regulator [Alphaproteobacteria bacterium]|nr:response regulator [Alphaproteobacteria bacterium]
MPEGAAHRVLILAPVGRDGPATAELLPKAGLAGSVCRNLEELVAELGMGAATLFVAEEALFARDLGALRDWVCAQPPWSDLPVIVLTSHHQDRRVTAWRHGLVESLGNVAMLERPVHPLTLTSTLKAAVRARQRQYEVKALLEAREQAAAALAREVDDATAELRRQMAERERMQDALRQAQKMEAIGQLTGGVAHDFNNLLMVISGGLDVLERNREGKRARLLIDGMRNAAERGAQLTRQLLAFARRRPLHTEPIDLARRLEGMRELLDRSLGDNIELEMRFEPGLWPVEVDAGELELVVLNLAVNARDAMPGGGKITVKAENVPASDCVRLAVIDTGTGMTPDVQARAVEPFFTTKEVGKGSGLGLAQAYGFARATGGELRIESELGRGTCIELTLPRSLHTPADQRMPEAEHETAHVRSGRHILLVEDDEQVASLVSDMLEQLGHDVLRASSAAAALGVVADGRQIDLVFSDIMMAGEMDGLGLAHELRRRFPDLPVLLTSGYADAARGVIEAGRFQVLAKPYRLEDLQAAMGKMFRADAH